MYHPHVHHIIAKNKSMMVRYRTIMSRWRHIMDFRFRHLKKSPELAFVSYRLSLACSG